MPPPDRGGLIERPADDRSTPLAGVLSGGWCLRLSFTGAGDPGWEDYQPGPIRPVHCPSPIRPERVFRRASEPTASGNAPGPARGSLVPRRSRCVVEHVGVVLFQERRAAAVFHGAQGMDRLVPAAGHFGA